MAGPPRRRLRQDPEEGESSAAGAARNAASQSPPPLSAKAPGAKGKKRAREEEVVEEHAVEPAQPAKRARTATASKTAPTKKAPTRKARAAKASTSKATVTTSAFTPINASTEDAAAPAKTAAPAKKTATSKKGAAGAAKTTAAKKPLSAKAAGKQRAPEYDVEATEEDVEMPDNDNAEAIDKDLLDMSTKKGGAKAKGKGKALQSAEVDINNCLDKALVEEEFATQHGKLFTAYASRKIVADYVRTQTDSIEASAAECSCAFDNGEITAEMAQETIRASIDATIATYQKQWNDLAQQTWEDKKDATIATLQQFVKDVTSINPDAEVLAQRLSHLATKAAAKQAEQVRDGKRWLKRAGDSILDAVSNEMAAFKSNFGSAPDASMDEGEIHDSDEEEPDSNEAPESSSVKVKAHKSTNKVCPEDWNAALDSLRTAVLAVLKRFRTDFALIKAMYAADTDVKKIEAFEP